MTEKYTPEKVAELVETANTMRAQLGEDYPKTGSILDLWLRAADALTAVSAERDAAIRNLAVADRQFTKLKEQTGSADAERIDLRAERDRLHKAITEALEVRRTSNLTSREMVWDMDRILRAALDKEGNDDE